MLYEEYLELLMKLNIIHPKYSALVIFEDDDLIMY